MTYIIIIIIVHTKKDPIAAHSTELLGYEILVRVESNLKKVEVQIKRIYRIDISFP